MQNFKRKYILSLINFNRPDLWLFAGVYQSQGFAKFNYSVIEICDTDLPEDSVIDIEIRWKDKLLSKEFGYNDN